MSSRFKVGEEVIYFTRHGAWKTSIVNVGICIILNAYEVSNLQIRYVKESNLRKDNKLNRKLYNIKE